MCVALHVRMQIAPTLGFGAATAAAGFAGTLATRQSVDSAWYRRLDKPAWQPPKQAFAPVWTSLYGLIATSGARIFRARPSKERTRALWLWGAQMVLNGGWSAIFFGARKPRAALAEQVLLLAAIGGYMHQARHVDRQATWMFAPYLAWTMFATALNASIVARNA